VRSRLALGGSRRRVVRQFLVESLTLSASGMAAGLLASAWGLALLARAPVLQTAGVHLDARLDARVLAVSAAAAIVAALVAGLLPAWRAARQPLTQGIRREAAAPGRWRAGSVLAVAQVSLSLLLLMTAGLFTRSLSQLKATDTNLAADRVLALQAQFGMEATPAYLRAAADRTIEALASLPGVVSAAAATTLPVSANGMQQRFDAGTTQPVVDADMQVELQFVSPKYFATIGLPLASGRVFSAGDEDANPIVVNESFARRYWPQSDAVGQIFRNKDQVFQVVGVARDTKYRSLSEPAALVMYRPLRQFPARTLSLVIRTDGPPPRLASAVRQRLQEAEPGVTLWSMRTLEEHIDRSLELDRARAVALALFAGLALLLVSLGVYGVMAYSVSRRLREMGIRLALGARPQSVAGLVLRRAALLAGAGILLGAFGVYASGRLIAAELHGTDPMDPLTLAGSAALLLAVASIASYLPARRASRVDPVAVLHLE
jgi:predicted permease